MKVFKQITGILLILVIGVSLSSWSSMDDPKNDTIEYLGKSSYRISNPIKLPFNYTAKRTREISVAIWQEYKWVSEKIVTVQKGSSKVVVTLPKDKLKKGVKYEIRYHIRPLKSTWKEALSENKAYFKAK